MLSRFTRAQIHSRGENGDGAGGYWRTNYCYHPCQIVFNYIAPPAVWITQLVSVNL